MIDADHWVWSTKRVPEVTQNERDMTKPTKFCRECGAKIPKDSRYCEECGRRLSIPITAPVTQPEVTQKCPRCGTQLPPVGWWWYEGKHICQRCAEDIRREMLAPLGQEEKQQTEPRTIGIVSEIERRTGRLIAAALVAGGLFLMLQPFLGFWSIVLSGIAFAVMSSTGYSQSQTQEADDAGYDLPDDIDDSEYDEYDEDVEDFDDSGER